MSSIFLSKKKIFESLKITEPKKKEKLRTFDICFNCLLDKSSICSIIKFNNGFFIPECSGFSLGKPWGVSRNCGYFLEHRMLARKMYKLINGSNRLLRFIQTGKCFLLRNSGERNFFLTDNMDFAYKFLTNNTNSEYNVTFKPCFESESQEEMFNRDVEDVRSCVELDDRQKRMILSVVSAGNYKMMCCLNKRGCGKIKNRTSKVG